MRLFWRRGVGRGWGGLVELFLRQVEGGVGGRDTGIDGDLQEHLFQIAELELVLAGRCARGGEIPPSVRWRRHDEDEQSPGARVECRTSPDGAPGVARDHFLKFAVEVGGCGDGFVHVRVAEHGAANFKSRLQWIACRRRQKKIEQRAR